MQLKKRFSVRKGVAAGAMAVAMLASSMPAMASNGFGHGQGRGLGLGIGLSFKAEADTDVDDDAQEHGQGRFDSGLKTLVKDVRDEVKSFWKLGGSDASATDSAQVAAAKACRKTAKSAYDDAAKAARAERDAGLKAALETFKTKLLDARAAYHATVDVSASSTPVSAETSAAARASYRLSYENGLQAFRDARATVMASYRTELAAARAAKDAATKTCKP